MTVNEERVTENRWARSRQGLPLSPLLIHKVLPGSATNELHVLFWLSANRIWEFLTLPLSNLPQNEIRMYLFRLTQKQTTHLHNELVLDLILGALVPDQIDTCTLQFNSSLF